MAFEASRQLFQPDSIHPHFVLCGVADQAALCRTLELLARHDIPCSYFREPDRGNELTTVAGGPVSGAARRIFRRYRCLNAGGFT
ncbi:MAG: hypothetical protein AB7K24_15525 [Gemmataceae bacterium]